MRQKFLGTLTIKSLRLVVILEYVSKSGYSLGQPQATENAGPWLFLVTSEFWGQDPSQAQESKESSSGKQGNQEKSVKVF